MNQPNFTASSNDCARAIVAIVEKVTGQSLPMETCSRIVACVSIELKHSHAQLVEQNERMRQALGELLSYSSKWLPVTFQPWGVNDTDNPLSRARAALNPPPDQMSTEKPDYKKPVNFKNTNLYGCGPEGDDDVYTVDEFKKCVEDKSFIDYDGVGHPVKDNLSAQNIWVKPSRVADIPADATHIVWFNR